MQRLIGPQHRCCPPASRRRHVGKPIRVGGIHAVSGRLTGPNQVAMSLQPGFLALGTHTASLHWRTLSSYRPQRAGRAQTGFHGSTPIQPPPSTNDNGGMNFACLACPVSTPNNATSFLFSFFCFPSLIIYPGTRLFFSQQYSILPAVLCPSSRPARSITVPVPTAIIIPTTWNSCFPTNSTIRRHTPRCISAEPLPPTYDQVTLWTTPRGIHTHRADS